MDKKRYYQLLNQDRTELRAIKFIKMKGKTISTVCEQQEVVNFEQFDSFCDKWNGKANVYAGIHERVPGGTKTKDVNCVKLIAIDIDATHPTNEAATEEELILCKKEAFEMVEELSQQYGKPCMVMTGNGYQLLWKIRAIIINDKNRTSVEQKIQKWISTIQSKYNSEHKSIDQIGDLARILKVPGTLSVKGSNTNDRPYRMASFVEYYDNVSENLRDEVMLTSIETIKPTERIKPKQGVLGKFDYLLTKDTKLSSLYNGNLTGYKSRSEAEMGLVCKLVYYEFADTEIDLIMRNSGIGKWSTASSQYKELTVSKSRLKVIQKKDDKTLATLEDVYNVLSKNYYLKDFYMVDLVMAVVLSQRLKGNSPVWMIFVGASGDGKSEMSRMIENLDCIYKIDQITPNTIVSGNPKVEDLAPELNNKIILFTDFASVLSLNSDSQRLIFAQLRNLYDGEAYKDSGAGARKHYTGLRITMIANSTPVINHRILIHQDLGTRELLYRTDIEETLEDFEKKARRALQNEGTVKDIRIEVSNIVASFLDNIEITNQHLSEETINWLFEKAKWLSIMRSAPSVDGYSGELISDTVPEVPTRLLMQLKVIYTCLKNLDKDYEDDRAKEIILRIINSSAKGTRVKIFQFLQDCDTQQSTSQISEALRLGKKTVLTECNVLWNLDLINCKKERVLNFGKENEISYWKRKQKAEKMEWDNLSIVHTHCVFPKGDSICGDTPCNEFDGMHYCKKHFAEIQAKLGTMEEDVK